MMSPVRMVWPLLLLLMIAAAQVPSRIDSLRGRLEHTEGRARVDVLNEMARLQAEERPEEGLGTGAAALETAEALDYARGEADALFHTGTAHFHLDHYDEAIRAYRRALEGYRSLGDVEAAAFCYERLGDALGYAGRYDEGVEAFETAIGHLEQAGNGAAAAEARNSLGLLHWRRGQFGPALPHFQRALQYWEGRDEKMMARVLNNVGTIYFHLGRYENALTSYRRSLALRRKQGNDRGVALVLNNIGLAYQEWGFPDRAYEIYQEAYEHIRPAGETMVLGYTLNNLGSILQERGDYEAALDYYLQSLMVSKAVAYVGGHIMSLTNIGKLQHELGRDEEALQYLEAARERARAVGALEQEANAIAEIGVVYQARGDAAEARRYFQRSLAISQTMKKRSLIKDNYRRLAAIHEDMGDLAQALHYHKAYQVLQDSVFDERSRRLLADMEMQYEAEKKEKENVLLRAAQQRNQLVIGLGSLLLIIVLISSVVLYILYRQKREANRKLSLSNERIAGQRDENKVLLHILSHDLANGLGNVRHCLELMVEEPDTLSEFGPLALQVTRNGIDVIALVRQMHALETGELEREPVELRKAVNDAATVVRDRLKAKSITLENAVDPTWRVQAERVSFVNSVLANVLTNAIKFSERGQAVRVDATTLDDGARMCLMVRDRGIGMPSDVLGHLFDLERASSRPGTEGEDGTGFGMPLVKRFVDLYGGYIEVRSHEAHETTNHGTEVHIVLEAAPSLARVDNPGVPSDGVVTGVPVEAGG